MCLSFLQFTVNMSKNLISSVSLVLVEVSPDALRMALLKSQVIFQSLYEDTRAVLEPFLHGMHVLFAGTCRYVAWRGAVVLWFGRSLIARPARVRFPG